MYLTQRKLLASSSPSLLLVQAKLEGVGLVVAGQRAVLEVRKVWPGMGLKRAKAHARRIVEEAQERKLEAERAEAEARLRLAHLEQRLARESCKPAADAHRREHPGHPTHGTRPGFCVLECRTGPTGTCSSRWPGPWAPSSAWW